MGKILRCPERDSLVGPVIFLAGPVQGAENWQEEAVKIIAEIGPDVNVVSPRRLDVVDGKFTPEMYREQCDWETDYLSRAGKEGTLLFWFAQERCVIPERAYAQTTRCELFEWKVKHERDGVNLCIGIEKDFCGIKYIRLRFGQDCPEVPICSSLRETCEKAVALCKNKIEMKVVD